MLRVTVLKSWYKSWYKNIWVQLLISSILLLVASPVLAQPLQIAQLLPTQAPETEVEAEVEASDADEAKIEEIAERFIDLIAAGQVEQARELLNPTLKAGWTLDQMQDDWDRLQRITGQYQRRVKTQVASGNLVLIDLEFEQATDNLFVIFDDQQRIQGVDFPLQLPRL